MTAGQGVRGKATTAASFALVLILAACTGGAPEEKASSGTGTSAPTAAGMLTEATMDTTRALPALTGRGSIAGTTPASARPTMAPVQAGTGLAGQALPTNQWWTSALTGPFSQPIWAHPLALRVTAAGIEVSAATPVATANSIVTPFVPAITTGAPIASLRVVGYGAFHVVLRATLRSGGAVEVTLVQGSPVLYLRFEGAAPSLTTTGISASTVDNVVGLDVAGQRWDVTGEPGARWRRDGSRLTGSGTQVAMARVPDGVDRATWDSATAGSATDPVTRTTATMAYDGTSGSVTQTLTAVHASGRPGVWALLPHQRAGLVSTGGLRSMPGSYPDALGPLSIVDAYAVQLKVSMPGLLTAAPALPLSAAARGAVLSDLDSDLADPPGAGGSYFGLKELGRLATIAEVARGIGATAQLRSALDRLRPQLVDWLTYSGPDDARYFAYDKTWGGLIAVPAEFGSSDYNDHHFQYGYLVRAAAVLAQADPGFARDYGPAVDLVVRDYSGASTSGDTAGFPAFRVFNAYLGHSAASGFAPFADGNNQESSSEAVAAWEAVVRWGTVRQDAKLVTYGITHYALEAATARMYWLGEGIGRQDGYSHTGAGIVWDAKIDYATFFDPRPESVQGIQLLPLTLGSLYRADPGSAAARSAELARAAAGAPRIWGDLFAADLALADPAAARRRLTPGLPREPSTSRALVRYWVELLAAFGPPQPAVAADGPYGLAFGDRDRPTLVAVNPTSSSRTVTFRANGAVLGSLSLAPGQTSTRRP